MAERFDFDSIYEQETWTVMYQNGDGQQERFYDLIIKEIEKSNFPNLDISIGEFITGGLIFGKETTKMLKLKATKSQFGKYEIYFRAQVFGNVVLFTRLECMERGFFNAITDKSGKELKSEMKRRCKNMAQLEEFIAIDSLGDLVYDKVLLIMDPEFRERKTLKSKSE